MRAEPVAGACGKGGEGGDMSNFDIPFIRQIPAHERTHAGKLGARPSQPECPSYDFDSYG